MGVARAWSRWPTEIFSPSLMHTVNDYLSDVGSKKAVSFMVPEKNVPPIVSFFYHGHILLLLLLLVVAYTFLSIIGCRQCSPISIRKLSGAITLDWKGLFSICKKPLVAKGL